MKTRTGPFIFQYSAFLLLSALFLFSCTEENKKRPNSFAPEVTIANGYIIPKDSMQEPLAIAVDESKLKKIALGNPAVILLQGQNKKNEPLQTVIAGPPEVFAPGKDSFPEFQILPTTNKVFPSGIPEIVVAKDAVTRDQGAQNFSFFGKQQGLKHGSIKCMMQDKLGNIWLGTGGGVTKYDGKYFTHYTTSQGLRNNSVNAMAQDKNGDIWFGTDGNGICKYDGKNFTHILENNSSPLAVNSLCADSEGNIWLASCCQGVLKYDGKNFTRILLKGPSSNNAVKIITIDKKENLWFGTTGPGLWKYDGKNFYHFTAKQGFCDNTVLSLLADKTGNLWFGTWGAGAFKYDGKLITNYSEKNGLCSNFINAIHEGKDGNIWCGSANNGISKYIPSAAMQTIEKRFTTYTEKDGLSNNRILSLLQDSAGNLWIGTDWGGVCKFNGNTFTHLPRAEGLDIKLSWCVGRDQNENTWVFPQDDGAYKFSENKVDSTQNIKSSSTEKTVEHYTVGQGLNSNTIYTFLNDKKGNSWFGYATGAPGISKFDGKNLIHFSSKEGFVFSNVFWMTEDRSGNLWMGTEVGAFKYDGKALTHYSKKNGLVDGQVRGIYEDKKGNIWFSTAEGAYSFDGKRFTKFTEKEGLTDFLVYHIIEDDFGNIWMGTYGDGVFRYDGKTFTHFTDKEGLANNNIFSIFKDRSGNIWFGTRFGLSELTSEKNKKISIFLKAKEKKQENDIEEEAYFKNYGYEDGLTEIGINSGQTMFEDKEGAIWICANTNITIFHPEADKQNSAAPNIQLTGIMLFNENINWLNFANKKDSTFVLGNGVTAGNFDFNDISKFYNLPQNLSLPYGSNYLTFNFIGITMSQPKNVQYEYKLEGLDENWSALTSRTEAQYGNLPSGTYTFKVKAMNSEGIWSNECSYTFTIRPPWYKTWWFRILAAFFGISAIWYYIKSREKKLVAQKEKLERTVEERTKEIAQKQKEIIDSIKYASRIQRALITSEKYIERNLNKLRKN